MPKMMRNIFQTKVKTLGLGAWLGQVESESFQAELHADMGLGQVGLSPNLSSYTEADWAGCPMTDDQL